MPRLGLRCCDRVVVVIVFGVEVNTRVLLRRLFRGAGLLFGCARHDGAGRWKAGEGKGGARIGFWVVVSQTREGSLNQVGYGYEF